jgi:diacylglycerol kinase (ATP)
MRLQPGGKRPVTAKHKIIVNPISGRGAGGRARPAIEQRLRDLGVSFDLVLSERPWHAAELAQQAVGEGYEVVVAAGGDGTANEVLNGLMQANPAQARPAAMGVMGIGRGNDFAFGVGIAAGVEAGCTVLAHGRRRRIDVGRAVGGLYPQGRYFGNGVGVGFDAVVGFEAVKMKPLSGFASYIAAALKTIFLYDHAQLVRLEYNGQTVTQPALMVSVMNGRRLGGGFMMAPDSRVDDGVFDLCIAGQASQAHILALLPRFMQGTQAADPIVRFERAPHLVVTALEGSLPAHADGETLCVDGHELTLELLPGGLEVVCPAPEAAA